MKLNQIIPLLLVGLALYPAADAQPFFRSLTTTVDEKDIIDMPMMLRRTNNDNDARGHVVMNGKRKLKGKTRILENGDIFQEPKADKDPKEKDLNEKDSKEKDSKEKDAKEKKSKEKDAKEKEPKDKTEKSKKDKSKEPKSKTTKSKSKTTKSKKEPKSSKSKIVINDEPTADEDEKSQYTLIQQSDDDTVKIVCPEKTTMENETTNSTASSNNTDVTIQYKYSLETTTNDLDQTETNLKRHMTETIGIETCPSRRLSASAIKEKARFHRRRLELIEMKTTAKDTRTGSCTPTSNQNNTCTEYEGEIVAVINDVGDNSNSEQITTSIMTILNYYARNEDLTGNVDENIAGMKLLMEDDANAEQQSESSAQGTSEKGGGSKGIAVAAGVAGAVILVYVGLRYKKRMKEQEIENGLIEATEVSKKGDGNNKEDSVVWAKAELVE